MANSTQRLAIELPMNELAALCKRWKIRELAVFGSVLREDFRPDSDVDFLVTFADGAGTSLFDLVDIEEELVRLLGRSVDIVDRSTVERSRNYIRRAAILESPVIIYAA